MHGKADESALNLPASWSPEAEDFCLRFGLDPDETTLCEVVESLFIKVLNGDAEAVSFVRELLEDWRLTEKP